MTVDELKELVDYVKDSDFYHSLKADIAEQLILRVVAAEKLFEVLGSVVEDLVQRDLPTTKETDELYLAYTAYGNLRKG